MKLRPYQHLIIRHILEYPRCAIFAGMGLGKTSSTLMALDRILDDKKEGPVLIIAPLRVARDTWPHEVKKWNCFYNFDQVRFIQEYCEIDPSVKVYSTNYESLPKLVNRYQSKWPFRIVVADELTRLKGFRAKQGTLRARALGQVARNLVKRFIGLTGTPYANGLDGIWGQMWFIDQGQRLGKSYRIFLDRYFNSYARYMIEPKDGAHEAIKALLSDVTLTIDPKDWFDLKDPIVNDIYVNLPPEAMLAHKRMMVELFAQIEGIDVETFNRVAAMLKCLQIANGAVYFDKFGNWVKSHNAKIEALQEIRESVEGPLLVAYHFKSDLKRIKEEFPDAVDFKSDLDATRRWNRGEIDMMLIHPASAGHGLNLQDGGNHLVFFSHWWDSETRQQVIERIGPTRQMQSGYDRPMFIHNIIAKGTIDTLVLERLRTKKSIEEIMMRAKTSGLETQPSTRESSE